LHATSKNTPLTPFIIVPSLAIGLVGLLAAIVPASALGFFPPDRSGIPPTPTMSWYPAVVSYVRLWGAIVTIAAAMVIVMHRWIVSYVLVVTTSLKETLAAARAQLRVFLREDRTHLITLFVLLAIGTAIRVYAASVVILQNDEALTYTDFASTPLYALVSNYRQPNNHIFHSFLVHIAAKLFGNEVFVLRLPALIAGCLILPALYIVGRRLYSKDVGLLAMALAIPAESLLYYSAQARGYSIVTLAFLLLVILATYLVRHRSAGLWLAFIFTTALGAFTIPVMLYPFGVVALWLFAEIWLQHEGSDRIDYLRDFSVSLVAIGALTLALYSFAIVISGIKSLVQNSYVVPRGFSDFLASMSPFLVTVWQMLNGLTPLIVVFIFVLGLVVSLIFHLRLSRYKIPLLIPTILWCAGFMLAQRNTPFVRVWLFISPVYLLAASAGIFGILKLLTKKWARRSIQIGSVALAILLCFTILSNRVLEISNIPDSVSYPDAQQVGIYLAQNVRPTDHILMIFPTYGVTNYYYLKNGGNPALATSGNNITDYPQSSRLLILTIPRITPIERVIKTSTDRGENVTPKLIYETATAQIYEINQRGIP
jgi:hypothetical protein